MRPLGIRGEDIAERFLRKKGYRIVARNFKTPVGEIDIVADDGGTLVFVEVKTRGGQTFGRPFEAVDGRKKAKLRKVALYYLKNRCKNDTPSRFDVLSIVAADGKEEIEHIVDAFE